VIELGAGLGYMSSLIAAKCQPRAIHSFEANPALIPYIHAVHRVNGIETVTVTNALLGARKAKAREFYVRGDFLASSLEDNLGDAHGGVVRVAEVPVLNVNTVLKEIRPTVMMCDIEGAEVELFAHADLSCLRAAVVELHPQWVGQAGVQAVFDAMAKSGLTYFPRSSNGKVVLFKRDW
jgi:FkbM family methyltransferase